MDVAATTACAPHASRKRKQPQPSQFGSGLCRAGGRRFRRPPVRNQLIRDQLVLVLQEQQLLVLQEQQLLQEQLELDQPSSTDGSVISSISKVALSRALSSTVRLVM
jgi:hypothetical protein